METNSSGTASPAPKDSTLEHEFSTSNVNDTLDELTVTSLDIMNDIIRNKKYLEEVLKDGSLHLAKARYILGSHSVSATQLPGEDTEPFSALCSIKVEFTAENGMKVPTFTLIREMVKGKGSDPLHWFGVLVPQNLRLAQTQFRSATDIIVDIACLQARLAVIGCEYLKLKAISKQEE